MLKDPRFTFPTDAVDRISAQMRSLRFSGPNTRRRSAIEMTEENDSIHAAIEEWINKRLISLDDVYLTKASLRLEYLELYGRKAGGVTVEMGYPNTCNLSSQRPEQVALIRKYLKRWNIDVSQNVVLDLGPLEPHPHRLLERTNVPCFLIK